MSSTDLVTQAELARWLGVSTRTVREYVGQKIITPVGAKGQFPLQASVVAVVAHFRSLSAGWTAESEGETLSPAAESAALNRQKRLHSIEVTRRAKVLAEIAEAELATVRGRLLDVSDVLDSWAAIIGAARQRFLGLPARLPTVIHGLSRQEIAVIADEVRDILEKLAADGDSVVADVARDAARRIAAADKSSTKGTTTDGEAPENP